MPGSLTHQLVPHACCAWFSLTHHPNGKDVVDDNDNNETSPFSLYADLRSCQPISYTLV